MPSCLCLLLCFKNPSSKDTVLTEKIKEGKKNVLIVIYIVFELRQHFPPLTTEQHSKQQMVVIWFRFQNSSPVPLLKMLVEEIMPYVHPGMKWSEWKKNKIPILNPSPLSQEQVDQAQPGMRLRLVHTITSMHVQVFVSGTQALPLSICRWQRRTVTDLQRGCTCMWDLAITTALITEHSGLNLFLKSQECIMMGQRFLNLCSCFLRTLNRSYLKPPSFRVIGESQSSAEDNNLPSITILPTLVWLHKLSLSCINLELNPWGWGINHQTLAGSLHFSDNEDSFIIISHSA